MTSERRVLLWMCLLVGVNQLGFGAMVPSLPLYANSFGVSASAIGIAVAVYGLARFLAVLPGGQFADRWGRRPVLAIGGIISAVGSFWCAGAHSFVEFNLARIVAGAGAGIILTVGQIVLADISSPDRRGRNIATYQAAFLFGFGIGPFPGGLLAGAYGLAAPFWMTGVASVLTTAIAWFLVSETRSTRTSATASGKAAEIPFVLQMLRLLSHRGFLLVSLISLMNAVVRTGGLFALIPLLATATLGLSVAEIGFAMMVSGVCGFAAAYPAGALADLVGRKAVIVPSTVLTGLSMVLFCYAPSYAWFIAASVVWSVSTSISSSAPAAYAADSAPAMNASAMSAYRMTADAGYVLGPPGLGLLADLTSPAVAIISASVVLVAIGAIFAVTPAEKRSLEQR
ncbi:MFS transporter [Bradyrhizobium sp. AUGA SZCCT0177]|uniref:MFS transporter n=1 Tax=Bradyrhizobium sp. AUGA SZCCT0177 TaxID=2807665 RepID=UPI001BA55014|nr:MFS transporter [Bradyrhizobium sp. AUGA SZCCT0177]MBR1281135.1 MFS transporter [Bradyrhizobium sp. AUGA SZCCT0177]